MRGGAATVAGRRLRLRARRPRLPSRAALPALSARTRRRLAALTLACLALAAAYWFWLRDSSLVAVDDVQVTGLTTDDAERIRAGLTTAGRSMTTLHVDNEALERAAAVYPVVRELRVSTDFPHGLRIHVVEHRPAAMADIGDDRIPVAGDGTLLRGVPVRTRLPEIEAEAGVRGARLRGHAALAAAGVAGAAPEPLRRRVEGIELRRGDGVVAELRDGPELIFGDARQARAKWAAAARVLADPDAAGASYIDVRLPGRPAAGGLPAETVAPVAPAGDSMLPDAGAGAAASAPTAAATTTPPDAALPSVPSPTGDGMIPPAGETTPPAAPMATPPQDVTGAGAVTAP